MVNYIIYFCFGNCWGDLIGEQFGLGYFVSVLLFVGAIVLIAIAYKIFKLNNVTAFWMGYILTRPLGASLGDLMSQSTKDGGLGLGTVGTSAIFLAAILIIVIYLAKTKRDVDKIIA